MGFRSGEFAGQSRTPTPWSFNQLLVLLAVWAGAKSCWKIKSASLKSWSAEGSWSAPKVLGKRVQWRWFSKKQWTNTSRWHCTPNHHRLWKLNTGLQATWAMSFSLPPDSRTFVSKWNTKLALIWKEDFGPLGNSPVLLLLSQVRRLWNNWAQFLDTSVCGGSWCLDPSLSPFLVKFTQILKSILLDNPHKAAVLSVVVHLFLPHFFLPLNFLLTCLDTALCEQPASLAWMFVAYPPCEGCQWLSSGQLSDQQSSPWLCS